MQYTNFLHNASTPLGGRHKKHSACKNMLQQLTKASLSGTPPNLQHIWEDRPIKQKPKVVVIVVTLLLALSAKN